MRFSLLIVFAIACTRRTAGERPAATVVVQTTVNFPDTDPAAVAACTL